MTLCSIRDNGFLGADSMKPVSSKRLSANKYKSYTLYFKVAIFCKGFSIFFLNFSTHVIKTFIPYSTCDSVQRSFSVVSYIVTTFNFEFFSLPLLSEKRQNISRNVHRNFITKHAFSEYLWYDRLSSFHTYERLFENVSLILMWMSHSS